MVLSKINSTVSYRELKSVNANDIKSESDVYQIELLDVDIIIAIGNVNNTYEDKNILYYPIYLVKYNNKVIQIGIYEIKFTDYVNYLDENNNLDVEQLDEPLIYKFVTKEFLNKLRLIPDIPLKRVPRTKKEQKEDVDKEELDKEKGNKEDIDVEELEIEELDNKEGKLEEIEYNEYAVIPAEREDIFILRKGMIVPALLKEETAKESKSNKEKYHESPGDLWINTFMKSKYYGIIDNEGGGDCLFATIRDAFESIGQQTTVRDLRIKLSKEVTDELFSNYKELYDMYNAALIKDTNDIKQLAQIYSNLKERFSNVLDRNEQKIITTEAAKIKKEHDRLVQEKKLTKNLLNEYKFMKGIETPAQLMNAITKSDFWAETWSISTLEKILNIKLIILSSEYYQENDLKNVLQCGQINDDYLKHRGVFNPEFYIMVDYNGTHYKLITYKNKRIFKFGELPFDIKMLITDKCMERNSGLYSIIPDFIKFKAAHKKKVHEEEYDDLSETKLQGLYNEDTILQFYSKSVDNPLPGRGSGEKIKSGNLKDYASLSTIPQWRKKLSNFWISEKPPLFTLDNHHWASVEHYYQGSKYKKSFPDFYLSFSLDSNTALSKDAAMAKAAGGKTGKFKGVQLRPFEVKPDSDFFSNRYKKEMYDAQYAKFSQNEDLKHLLLSTNDAKLVHFVRGKKPIVFNELMIIRNKLNNP
jgi:predicted NAD-dependent protein-ADP-ribosyltransferase YbiA (DUF1768 family)